MDDNNTVISHNLRQAGNSDNIVNCYISALWTHVKLDSEGSALATCNVCKLDISDGGKDRVALNTINLMRHSDKHTEP